MDGSPGLVVQILFLAPLLLLSANPRSTNAISKHLTRPTYVNVVKPRWGLQPKARVGRIRPDDVFVEKHMRRSEANGDKGKFLRRLSDAMMAISISAYMAATVGITTPAAIATEIPQCDFERYDFSEAGKRFCFPFSDLDTSGLPPSGNEDSLESSNSENEPMENPSKEIKQPEMQEEKYESGNDDTLKVPGATAESSPLDFGTSEERIVAEEPQLEKESLQADIGPIPDYDSLNSPTESSENPSPISLALPVLGIGSAGYLATRIPRNLGNDDEPRSGKMTAAILRREAKERLFGLIDSSASDAEIDTAAAELEGYNPVDSPTDGAIDGKWILQYSTEGLVRNVRRLAPKAGISQEIDLEAGIVTNQIGQEEDDGPLRLQAQASLKIQGENRIFFKFDNFNAVIGGFQVPLPVQGAGWSDTVYVDEDSRVVRNSLGDLLIYKKSVTIDR